MSSFELIIARGPSSDEGTFGVATLGDQSWTSLELPWRENATNISCIPHGQYKTAKVYSPRFSQLVFLLLNVPGRSEVEMHPANWAGDMAKGYFSNLRGCITLGQERGSIVTPTGREQSAVMRSGAAIRQLMQAVGAGTLTITIADSNS
jgi:hypothetical protein